MLICWKIFILLLFSTFEVEYNEDKSVVEVLVQLLVLRQHLTSETFGIFKFKTLKIKFLLYISEKVLVPKTEAKVTAFNTFTDYCDILRCKFVLVHLAKNV